MHHAHVLSFDLASQLGIELTEAGCSSRDITQLNKNFGKKLDT